MKNNTLSKTNQSAEDTTPQSGHATPVVEKYVEKRKEKAEDQVNEEANSPARPKPTKSIFDEWTSLKYVIL